MYQIIYATCCLSMGLAVVPAQAKGASKTAAQLRGSWIARTTERNGNPAPEVVGHRLTFTGNRFVITSPKGQLLYQGTFEVNTQSNPPTIDFRQTSGALKGKVWKGIYSIKGATLRICDNAPDLNRERPSRFQAPAKSGYIAIVFQRTRDSAIKEITTRLNQLNLAFKNADVATMKRLMTRDHRALLPYYKKPRNNEELLKGWSDFNITRATTGKRNIKFISKDVALITYPVRYKGTYKGKPMLTPNYATAVWVKRNGQWLENYYQETPLQGE